MADSSPDSLVFSGSSPEECETFVSTIRKRALAEKKHRDNEWIAYLASSCFVGDALYWYEDLDQEIQDDWSRLRPAMMAKFGRTRPPPHDPNLSISAPQAAASSITIPTPAAAPPVPDSIPLLRKGLLKVLGLNGRCHGYIAARIENGQYRSITETPQLALSVLLPPSSSKHIFEIKVAPNDSVGIVWPNLSGAEWTDDTRYFAYCCSWSTIRSANTWAVNNNVWKLADDSELSVHYPKLNGDVEPLRAHLESRGATFCWFKSSRAPSRDYERVRVLFEPTE